MFKTKQELIKEHMGDGNCGESQSWNIGFKCGVNVAFESIAERVEFYEKYKDHLNWLHDQQLYIYVQYQKEIEIIIGECSPKIDLKYNNWLFDYCFKDGLNVNLKVVLGN